MIDKMKAYEESFKRRQSMDMLLCENDHMATLLDEIRNIPLSLSTPDGPVTIPLTNVASVKRVTIPGEVAHYNIACAQVQSGDLGAALTALEAAFKAGFDDWRYVMKDPDLAVLRGTPGLQQLRERVRQKSL